MSRFVNKGLIVLILVSCLSMTGIACSGDSREAEGELTTVSIALDWFPWANHSGLFVAKERGYFEDQGLDVNIYVPGDPSIVLQTVAAGRDDFGISYQPEVLIAREQGIKVVSIMAMVQHPLNSIMTKSRECCWVWPSATLSAILQSPWFHLKEKMYMERLEITCLTIMLR